MATAREAARGEPCEPRKQGSVRPEPVQEDRDRSAVRRHEKLFRRGAKAPLSHRLQKRRGILATGVGDQYLAAGCEEGGDQGRERRDVPLLIEHVGSEDEIEGTDAFDMRRVPVEEPRTGLAPEVREGVVAGEVEGGRVVVGDRDPGPVIEGGHAWEPDAAAEFDDAPAREALSAGDPTRERHGARPQVRPVGEPLVPGELLLVYERVGRDGVRYAVGRVPDLDGGLGEPGEAAKVGAEARAEVLRLFAGGAFYPVTEEVAAGSVCVPASASSSAAAARMARVSRSLVAISAMV